MSAPANVFDDLNTQIAEFVNRPENLRLRPATGNYSALFRGSLFGLDSAADVAERLKTSNASVLWLGTNPNVPQSLNYVLNPPDDEGHYPQFERQRQSGLFASARWGDAGPMPDWNPLQRPQGGWGVYRDVFTKLAHQPESLAMANVIPWGSADAKALATGVGGLDARLLGRLLEFADGLNTMVVEALSPTLVAVPFSLGVNRELDRASQLGIALAAAKEIRSHTIPGLKSKFTFHTAWCRRGVKDVRTVYLRHPASLHFSTDDRKRIVAEVASALAS